MELSGRIGQDVFVLLFYMDLGFGLSLLYYLHILAEIFYFA